MDGSKVVFVEVVEIRKPYVIMHVVGRRYGLSEIRRLTTAEEYNSYPPTCRMPMYINVFPEDGDLETYLVGKRFHVVIAADSAGIGGYYRCAPANSVEYALILREVKLELLKKQVRDQSDQLLRQEWETMSANSGGFLVSFSSITRLEYAQLLLDELRERGLSVAE